MKLSCSSTYLAVSTFCGAALLLQVPLAGWSSNLALALAAAEPVVLFLLLRFVLKPCSVETVNEVKDTIASAQPEETADLAAENDFTLTTFSEVRETADEVQAESVIHGTAAYIKETVKEFDSAVEDLQSSNDDLTRRLTECVGALQGSLPVLDIQNAQLFSITEDTEQAAFKIVSGITDVRQAVSEMIAELTARMSESEQAVAQSNSAMQQFKELQRYIERRSGEIADNLDQDQTQLDDVVQTTRALSQYVESVSAVTNQTKILALNASIEAARAGEQGRGFAVVAQEMRRLSNESREAAESLGGQIRQITLVMETQLKQRLVHQASAGELERNVLGELERQFVGLGDQYVAVVSGYADLVKETTEKNQALSGKVMSLLAGIQFQDITRQKIEQVIKSLTLTKEQFEQKTADNSQFAAVSNDVIAERLFDSYVMNDQRITHLKTIGKEENIAVEETALPTIELF